MPLFRVYVDGCYVYRLTLPDAPAVINLYLDDLIRTSKSVGTFQMKHEEDFEEDDPPIIGALSVICQRSVRYADDGNIIAQWHKWKIIEKTQDEWRERLEVYNTIQEARGAINEIAKLRNVGDY